MVYLFVLYDFHKNVTSLNTIKKLVFPWKQTCFICEAELKFYT